MDGGAWWATIHTVAKSRTQLSDFTFTLLQPIQTNTYIKQPILSELMC